MTKRKGRSGSFFKPSGDPIGDIIAAGANILVSQGLQRFSRETAKILGINQTPIQSQIELNRSQLQLEKLKLDIEKNKMLSQRQLRILDIKIMEKEAELKERLRRIESGQAEESKIALPSPTEVVVGALEVTANPEGLISPEQSESYYLWLNSLEGGKIILILGRRGSGKTALAGKIGEYMLVTRRMPIYWVGLPTQARGFLPHWISMVDSPEQCPVGCIIIIDESGLNYLSLAFATERNKLLRSLMMICRHKYILLVFAGQNSRDIDLSIIRQADCLIFKEPGAFQFDTERPDLRRLAKVAVEAFRGIPLEERREAAYVFDDNFQGIIKSTLPSFWSEDFSKIYANFDLPTIKEQVDKKNEIQKAMVEETKLLNEASQEKKILELRRQGYGIEKIAKTLGISTWAVRKCLYRCE